MIFCDVFEPPYIRDTIASLTETQTIPLNSAGLADYMWEVDGHVIQVERKQWAELVDMEHVEEQLRRELCKADETYLLVEGIMLPEEYGITLYRSAPAKDSRGLMYKYMSFGSMKSPRKALYQQMQAFLWSLDRQGISIIQTPSSYATALALVTMHRQFNKTEHKTFNRYIRVKPVLPDLDPAVLTLMSLYKVELGEYKAKQLIAVFGTVGKVFNATEKELAAVPGIGKVTARKIKELLV